MNREIGTIAAIALASVAGATPRMSFALADVEMGARPLGMGGAYTASAQDAHALWWNAAGLSAVERTSATFMHGLYPSLSGTGLDYLGIVLPGEKWGIGLAWGQAFTTVEEGPSATTSRAVDSAGILGIGSRVPALEGARFGFGFKWQGVSSSAGGPSSFGLDVGALYEPPQLDLLTIGLALRNLAGPSPLAARLGASATFLPQEALRVGAELETKQGINDVAGTTFKIHAGAEYRVIGKIPRLTEVALRAGYDADGATAGVGVTYDLWTLDYAGTFGRSYGAQHRLALSAAFGQPRAH